MNSLRYITISNHEEICNGSYRVEIDTKQINKSKDKYFIEKLTSVLNNNGKVVYLNNGVYSCFFQTEDLIEKIHEYLQKFESEILEKYQKSNELFNRDAQKPKLLFENEKLKLPFVYFLLPESKKIAVILTSFTSSDLFKSILYISNSSGFCNALVHEDAAIMSGNKSIINEINFIIKDKRLANKKMFIINSENYSHLLDIEKKLINDFKMGVKLINQELNETLQKNTKKYTEIEITEQNPFKLQIKYNEELNLFEFYCVGYEKNVAGFSYFKSKPTRNSIENFARNFLYSTPIEGLDLKAFIEHTINANRSYPLGLGSREEITLEKLPYGLYKENHDCFLIPIKEADKLQIIKNNFLFFKEVFEQNPTKLTFNKNAIVFTPHEKYPFIYTDSQNAFLCFSLSQRYANGRDPSIIIKGFQINPKWASYFLEETDMSGIIKLNSINVMYFLNGKAVTINHEEAQKQYESTMQAFYLNYSMGHHNPKNKKIKI